jgi:hypothetical protein
VSSSLCRIPGARIGVRYLLTSLGFWVLFNTGTLLWHQQFQGPYFRQPSILALTHLAALGWLTTGFMGVMYVTLPATLRVRANSVRLAHVQYWLQVVGIAGLVLTMGLVPQARGRVVCGLLTLGALVIFAHNIAGTVGRGKAWHLPEAHFVMAMFYLAITGLIGMTYVFYLNWGAVPQTMTHLKVHAHFAGLGWLTLTLMGLTYKLLPLELGVDKVTQHWSLAASVLINLVFWGVFFGYAYDLPGLRIASAILGLGGIVCHTVQVQTIARGHPSALIRKRAQSQGEMEAQERPGSLPYTQASCLFGIAAAMLATLLTTGAIEGSAAVEYAYGYVAGAGWFGLYVTGQTMWLMPLLHDQGPESGRQSAWMALEFPGQVAGTTLLTSGLLVGIPVIVALGAAVNLGASLFVTGRSVRLCLAQPAMAER